MKKELIQFLRNIPGAKSLYSLTCRQFFYRWRMCEMFRYDRNRFFAHALHAQNPTQESALAEIVLFYHTVEKGLTMPNMRLGFGCQMLFKFVGLLNSYAEKYDITERQFVDAVRVLAEYKKIHDDARFELDSSLSNAIDTLLKRIPVEPSCQIEMTRERYWAELNSPFEMFSASRHSVRHFSGTISEEQIRNAVALANNAPSACNRQYTRVHCVSDRAKIQACLALQGGNRGFGHLADKLLVVTADLRGLAWAQERNDLFTNAGIYLMNLCYALHKNRVAHCMLNWSVTPSVDRQLRNVLEIPEAESIVILIACGDVPKTFKLASSPRKPAEETLVFH